MSTATLTHRTHSLLARMRAHLETVGELHAHQVRHLDGMVVAPAKPVRTQVASDLRVVTDVNQTMSEIMFREQSR